jgi:hypothetical protein
VEIETWFQEEGRISACRNWIIRNITTGEDIGVATRFDSPVCVIYSKGT